MMSSMLQSAISDTRTAISDTRSIHSSTSTSHRTLSSSATCMDSTSPTTKSQISTTTSTTSSDPPPSDNVSSVSFLTRVTAEMGSAMSDAYGHLIHGDDPGKSARLVFLAHPKPFLQKQQSYSKFDLGMTFCEINDRAYVKSVTPGSEAAIKGVQVQDCVQFAIVLGGPNLVDLKEEKVETFALECEKRGMRISYDELRDMFVHCCVSSFSSSQEDKITFESPPTCPNNYTNRAVRRTINKITQKTASCTHQHQLRIHHHHSASSSSSLPSSTVIDEAPSSPANSDGAALYPVALVFRRTRKRKVALGGLAQVPGFPTCRLDDECDRAASLIRRLAPTKDTQPQPDAWDEIVHDGIECFMGPSPQNKDEESTVYSKRTETEMAFRDTEEDNDIPLDAMEQRTTVKLSEVRQRMMTASPTSSAASLQDDVEASTIRSMIQRAVGLAFIRMSKIVLGVSVHAGTGIVIARLGDGTWSAPSAIGSWGVGLGIQFGMEVADFIFILQTEDSLEHFRRGGHFTIGGNVGAAVAGLGREAYGAASVGLCGTDTTPPALTDDTSVNYDRNSHRTLRETSEIAPIVAYAKSQGLYFGVSLEGSRIFTREDINARTYKFATGKAVPARDILGGNVSTPIEAEDLYASLHSVEFTHDISNLPHPPEVLQNDSMNNWEFDRSTLTDATSRGQSVPPFSFLSNITEEESDEFSKFETKFKKFLYGGVSVQRFLPEVTLGSGEMKRERRTLWLMLPEVGALRLGFISKRDRENGALRTKGGYSESIGAIDDYITIYSDDYTNGETTLGGSTIGGSTYDGTTATRDDDRDDASRRKLTGKVRMSDKHCIALTDVTLLSQDPNVLIPSSSGGTESLRLITIRDVSGTSLLFIADNLREAELLVCGLKLLIERETSRLGVRGGVPVTQLGGSVGAEAMSPSSARGFHKEEPMPLQDHTLVQTPRRNSGTYGKGSGYESSDNDDEGDALFVKYGSSISTRHHVPEGRKSWSEVPSRNHLRDVASRSFPQSEDIDVGGLGDPKRPLENTQIDTNHQENIPKYVHGQLLVRDVATNVNLPLPLPLCRVLLLDSTSPVITKWEIDRGDTNYVKKPWAFPPATARERENHSSEHQLIASGSMMGAHRSTSYDRIRNGEVVHLSEIQIVDADDSKKLAFTVTERMPRRGFSIKMRILLRSATADCCEATILGEFRPMGKNMSNQLAVHKAFHLVLDEVTMRYGTEGTGLLAGFLNVINNFPEPGVTAPPTNVIFSSPKAVQSTSEKPFTQTFGSQNHTNDYPQGEQSSMPREAFSQKPEPHSQGGELPQHQQRSLMPSADPSTATTRNLVINTEPSKKSYNTSHTATRKELISPNKQEPVGGRVQNESTKSPQDYKKPAIAPRERKSRRPIISRDSSSTDKVRWRDRPPTPTMLRVNNNETSKPRSQIFSSKDFADMPGDDYVNPGSKRNTIQVKPLPKIRLSLMPSPREEDEENESAGSPAHQDKKKHHSRSKKSGSKKRSSRRSSRRHKSAQRVEDG